MQNNTLPPIITSSEPGSFAYFTIRERKPEIIDLMLEINNFSPSIKDSFRDFQKEMVSGRVKPLVEDAPDREIWQHDLQNWIGKRWIDIPWYLAEAFFYRRILEISHYFQPGPNKGIDPFEKLKQQEMIESIAVFEDLYPSLKSEQSYENFFNYCVKTLWGNRGDLSFTTELDKDMDTQHHRIILDQSQEAYDFLAAAKNKSIAYILDNAGKELIFDFALIDYLLQTKLADKVTCYFKNQPFYVSDAMPIDFDVTVDTMKASKLVQVRGLSQRMIEWRKSGKVTLKAPAFLTYGRTFDEMPVELHDQFAIHDLTIFKGDLNYRRLMRDLQWDPTTPVEVAASYFPTSFLCLRTLKAELIVGLSKELLTQIESESDPDWLTNGKRGLITFYQKNP